MKTYQMNFCLTVNEDVPEGEVLDKLVALSEENNWSLGGGLVDVTNDEDVEPDPKLIDSMCMRYRHDFGLLDDFHKKSIRVTMTQLWEEVVGLGFYQK